MSTQEISVKPNNHRVYQCPTAKKTELLNKIISENKTSNILIVCSDNPQRIIDALENKDIKVIEDKALIKNKSLRCELLISYDLPIKNIVYMARFGKATHKAILLLDESEQKELYQTEMLLGRAIKQEVIEGFEYAKVSPKPEMTGRKPMTKEQIKEVAKKRYEAETQEPEEKSYDKPKREYAEDRKPYDKNGQKTDYKKAPNKFLGKDENGKAIFSGKSGDRNHRYDGTPRNNKVGRTISIKSRKPKEEE